MEAGLIPIIIKTLLYGEFKVQKEALWTIYNIIYHGDMEQVRWSLSLILASYSLSVSIDGLLSVTRCHSCSMPAVGLR